MAIKATRAGSQPSRRRQAPTYTQAQVDFILQQRMESYHLAARELRQLLMDLCKTRQPGRQPGCIEISKYSLMRVLAKSAELSDI
jgi:hypothetical protein